MHVPVQYHQLLSFQPAQRMMQMKTAAEGTRQHYPIDAKNPAIAIARLPTKDLFLL